jgi:hypothetical protein
MQKSTRRTLGARSRLCRRGSELKITNEEAAFAACGMVPTGNEKSNGKVRRQLERLHQFFSLLYPGDGDCVEFEIFISERAGASQAPVVESLWAFGDRIIMTVDLMPIDDVDRATFRSFPTTNLSASEVRFDHFDGQGGMSCNITSEHDVFSLKAMTGANCVILRSLLWRFAPQGK